MAKLRLVLGDDHTLFRHGLRKILEEQPEWLVVAEVGDGREAVRQCLELKPDVAVLDVAMPILNGIEAAHQITRQTSDIGVLIVSMHSDDVYVARALQAGAKGYMVKDSAADELVKAVSSIAVGHAYFSPAVANVMLNGYVRRAGGNEALDRYDLLSAREREIFQLIAEARTSREVAQLLEISAATVETHRARIMQKLDVHNTAELVLFAVRRGIVS